MKTAPAFAGAEKEVSTMDKKEKVQKPLYKKWWFWVIIVVVIAAFGSAGNKNDDSTADSVPSGSVTSTPEPSASAPVESNPAESDPAESTPEPDESTPVISEEDKEAATALDAEIFSICTAAEQEYSAFVSLLSAEGTTNLDAYNAAKTLKNNLTDYNYRQLSGIKGNGLDEFEDYKENTSLYIFMMSETADAAMAYLDDSKTSNLSKYQEAAEKVSTYALPVVTSRIAFLSASGLSDEELGALLDSSVTE